MSVAIELIDVNANNWRQCADLQVDAAQQGFVSPVTRYLCLCHYGGLWKPLAISAGGQVVGFVMWAMDPSDRSGWIGGLVIALGHQRRGYGRAAMLALIQRLRGTHGCASAALSYDAANAPARALYRSLGFVETGEREDDEIVARLRFADESVIALGSPP